MNTFFTFPQNYFFNQKLKSDPVDKKINTIRTFELFSKMACSDYKELQKIIRRVDYSPKMNWNERNQILPFYFETEANERQQNFKTKTENALVLQRHRATFVMSGSIEWKYANAKKSFSFASNEIIFGRFAPSFLCLFLVQDNSYFW